jgi:hypothetical protein
VGAGYHNVGYERDGAAQNSFDVAQDPWLSKRTSERAQRLNSRVRKQNLESVAFKLVRRCDEQACVKQSCKLDLKLCALLCEDPPHPARGGLSDAELDKLTKERAKLAEVPCDLLSNLRLAVPANIAVAARWAIDARSPQGFRALVVADERDPSAQEVV